MNFNDEDFLRRIVGVGTLGYSLEKIMNVLDIPTSDMKSFTDEFYNKNSEVYRAYKKGIDKADYVIDMKLFEEAKSGNIRALKKYEERKDKEIYRQRRAQTLKDEE
jgi:hypothetical protein